MGISLLDLGLTLQSTDKLPHGYMTQVPLELALVLWSLKHSSHMTDLDHSNRNMAKNYTVQGDLH